VLVKVVCLQLIMSLNIQLSTLRFHIQSAPPTFSPRLGTVALSRLPENTPIEVPTPGLITSTSRGVVPHLSGDHTALSESIRWVHVPFESL
jgi:queuine tRNA-ribosyltransferase